MNKEDLPCYVYDDFHLDVNFKVKMGSDIESIIKKIHIAIESVLTFEYGKLEFSAHQTDSSILINTPENCMFKRDCERIGLAEVFERLITCKCETAKDHHNLPSYVYIFINNDNGNIKIGFTRHINKRFKSIQTAIGTSNLDIYGYYTFNDNKEAHRHEKQLLDYFSKYKTHGEWIHTKTNIFKTMLQTYNNNNKLNEIYKALD